MPLTRTFKMTIQACAERDAAFRESLLTDGVQTLIAGDLETGKSVVRDYINAMICLNQLAAATGTPSKSLMRTLSSRGNPNARNLFSKIGHLQRSTGCSLSVRAG